MEKQYSWKRTEEIEMNLADLLHRLCGQWKLILVFALVTALIFGGYEWVKGRDRPDTAEQDKTEEAVMTETEEQAVADAVRLKNEISGLETYLDNSILMQLDPYHKARYIMLYCVDHAERQELLKITES